MKRNLKTAYRNHNSLFYPWIILRLSEKEWKFSRIELVCIKVKNKYSMFEEKMLV